MIFDSNIKKMYRTNTEVLNLMGMKIKKGSRPHYVKLINHEHEYKVWFNFKAIESNGGIYTNPIDNSYINIYKNNDDEIEQIVPENMPIGGEEKFLRIVFKKNIKKESMFAGIYVLDSVKGRSEFFKRISTTFNSEDVYEITPTENYYEYLNNQSIESSKEFYNTFIKLRKKLDVYSLNDESDFVDDENINDIINSETIRKYRIITPQIKESKIRKGTWLRNKQIANNAILKCGCVCEFDTNHDLFFKSDDSKYIEVHHLIPMNAQKDFSVPLDREENIVCLCPTCHREIHFGKNKDMMIKTLLSRREDDLAESGIKISFEDIKKYY